MKKIIAFVCFLILIFISPITQAQNKKLDKAEKKKLKQQKRLEQDENNIEEGDSDILCCPDNFSLETTLQKIQDELKAAGYSVFLGSPSDGYLITRLKKMRRVYYDTNNDFKYQELGPDVYTIVFVNLYTHEVKDLLPERIPLEGKNESTKWRFNENALMKRYERYKSCVYLTSFSLLDARIRSGGSIFNPQEGYSGLMENTGLTIDEMKPLFTLSEDFSRKSVNLDMFNLLRKIAKKVAGQSGRAISLNYESIFQKYNYEGELKLPNQNKK